MPLCTGLLAAGSSPLQAWETNAETGEPPPCLEILGPFSAMPRWGTETLSDASGGGVRWQRTCPRLISCGVPPGRAARRPSDSAPPPAPRLRPAPFFCPRFSAGPISAAKKFPLRGFCSGPRPRRPGAPAPHPLSDSGASSLAPPSPRACSAYALRFGLLALLAAGPRARQTRKPTFLPRTSAPPQKRNADRQYLAPSYHEPPRNTRSGLVPAGAKVSGFSTPLAHS